MSIKFDTAIDYQIPAEEYEKQGASPSDLTVNYIIIGMRGKYPQGIEGQKKRIWGRIQRKLDVVMDGGSTVLDLETTEVEFLQKVFTDENVKFPLDISKYVMMCEDAILALGIEPEEQVSPKKG